MERNKAIDKLLDILATPFVSDVQVTLRFHLDETPEQVEEDEPTVTKELMKDYETPVVADILHDYYGEGLPDNTPNAVVRSFDPDHLNGGEYVYEDANGVPCTPDGEPLEDEDKGEDVWVEQVWVEPYTFTKDGQTVEVKGHYRRSKGKRKAPAKRLPPDVVAQAERMIKAGYMQKAVAHHLGATPKQIGLIVKRMRDADKL